MKTCSRCKKSKTLSAFSKESKRKDGLRPDCKECVSLLSRQRLRAETFEQRSSRLTRMRSNYQKRKTKPRRPVVTKKCRRCGEEKSIEAFGINLGVGDGYTVYCRKCSAQYARERREARMKDPEYRARQIEYGRKYYRSKSAEQKSLEGRKSRLKKYGLTPAEYDAMLKEQDHRCPVCAIEEPNSPRVFPVDHDHGSGKIRGLLCADCNTGIGLLKDDPNRVAGALTYLVTRGSLSIDSSCLTSLLDALGERALLPDL